MRGSSATANNNLNLPPQIYEYHDYRDFLRDWVAFRKKEIPTFSMRRFAKEAGLSIAYLSMILNGERNFSDEALEKALPVLNLDQDEISYFKCLKIISDSESQEERLQAMERIQKMAAYKNINHDEIEAYRYLTNWYYVAIREMVALPDFKLDPEWIQSRLKYFVHLNDVTKALRFLTANGFIIENQQGKAELPEKQVHCIGGVYKLALTQFHREMFSLASESIDSTPREKRNLTFHTLAISEEQFGEVRKILDDALEKVKKLGETNVKPDSVYHVSLATFPLTKQDKKDDGE